MRIEIKTVEGETLMDMDALDLFKTLAFAGYPYGGYNIRPGTELIISAKLPDQTLVIRETGELFDIRPGCGISEKVTIPAQTDEEWHLRPR